MYSSDSVEPTSPEPTIIEAPQEHQEAGAAEDLDVQCDATPPAPRRRLQIGEWYVTLAMVGALIGLFVAGILVALNQAFPDGTSGTLNPGVLTGIAIGIIIGASALGALMAGTAQAVAWGWRRAKEPRTTGLPASEGRNHPRH